eukprot:1047989-Prymnesium_polylepis.1
MQHDRHWSGPDTANYGHGQRQAGHRSGSCLALALAPGALGLRSDQCECHKSEDRTGSGHASTTTLRAQSRPQRP